jgi:hypothetical protein
MNKCFAVLVLLCCCSVPPDSVSMRRDPDDAGPARFQYPDKPQPPSQARMQLIRQHQRAMQRRRHEPR